MEFGSLREANDMNYRNYLRTIEKAIRDSVTAAFPRSWDENHVTFAIAHKFQTELREHKIEGLARPLNVRWDAFKMGGSLEHAHGDIAILVRYISWESELIEGVGFLEAKRIFPSGQYDSLDWCQLVRINQLTAFSSLLLYDSSQVSEFADSISFHPFTHGKTPATLDVPYSYAVVVQTPLAILLHTKSRSLHKYSMPLSYQICARFLCVKDLNFDAEIVAAVKGYAKNKIDGPSYLLVASVSSGDVAPQLTEEVGVNLKEFSPLSDLPRPRFDRE